MKCVLSFILTLALSGLAHATDRLDAATSRCCAERDPASHDVRCTVADREMWDILFYFETTSSSQSGVATDGEHIYTSSFSTEMFRKFEMDGTFVEEFTIPGIPTANCMTYDGTYFYACRGPLEDGIYVLDLESHLLLDTIPVSAPSIVGIGHISHDPELDEGNGGFWVGYWWEMAALDMHGNQLIPNAGAPGGIAGTAYDNVTDPANPCLYAFLQTGATDLEFYRFDINTLTYSDVIHDASDIPGGSTNPVASGCDSYINKDAQLVLLGMIDHFPNNEVVFGYEIARTFVYTNDISVQALVAPVSGDDLGATEDVTVRLLNNGTAAQSGFDLQYTIDDGTGMIGPFAHYVSATLEPGEELDVTFDDTADLSSPGTIYTFVITSFLSADENPANDVLTKTVGNTSGVYCYASGSGGPEYISHVAMGDVSNPSGYDHYADYSQDPDLFIDLEQGVATQLTITIANGYHADVGAVWIDWDRDYDFYDDGYVFVSEFGPGPYVTDVTPPAYALENTHLRMRIRLDYNNPAPDPCGTPSFGEVEDYTVIVRGGAGADDDPGILTARLGRNYPNPSDRETTISFTTRDRANTAIYVCDLEGRVIRTLVNEALPAGHHTVVWNGHSEDGEAVASGLYFYKMVSGSYECTRKLTLLR